jgi:nucleoside-diphosphate-sugar epimerase
MRVFVTGGTGFIGSAVVARLRGRGDEVRALVRHPEKARDLKDLGCELVPGDLGDAGAIREAMRGCDAVIHGAAIYEVGIPAKRRAAMYQANVEGTETVLGAALQEEVPKVVYISTVNAFGNTEGRIVDESHVHSERYVSYYDETKHLAHKAARRLIAEGLPCVIVQPGAVYGPGDHSAVGLMMRQLLSGRLPAMMFPETGLNLVHVDDVADGILLALDRGRPGEQYVLGGEITTLGDMLRTLARISGRRPPRLTLPAGMLRLSAPLGPLLGPAMGFPPNFRELVSASDGVTYWARDDRARRELGYAPRSLEKGLEDLLAAGR